jgi:hypothetical protein
MGREAMRFSQAQRGAQVPDVLRMTFHMAMTLGMAIRTLHNPRLHRLVRYATSGVSQ